MSERERKVQRTWSITERTAERVKQLAAKNEIFDSLVVEKLLQHALDEIEAGRWPIKRIPIKYKIEW